MHFLCLFTDKRIEDFSQVESHKGFAGKLLYGLTFPIRHNYKKCDRDFRELRSSASHTGNSQYLDCNFNSGMVIRNDTVIIARLLADRPLRKESIGKFGFRFDPVV